MTARTYSPAHADGDTIYAAFVNAIEDDIEELSVLTALGDLMVGGAAGAETRLAVGQDGYALIADSTTAIGLVWNIPRPLLNQREMQVLINAGVATLTTVGFTAAPTVTGTPSSTDDADGPSNNYASGAVSGNTAGLNSAATVCRRDWSPRFTARIKTPSTITLNRFWVGLFSAAPTGSATPAGHLAGFRYDTAADGTAFWRCCTDDNGSAPTVTTTTVAVAADTRYVLTVWPYGSGVAFYINGVFVANHTTDLPGATTMLSWYAMVTTLSAAARNLKVSRVALSHD